MATQLTTIESLQLALWPGVAEILEQRTGATGNKFGNETVKMIIWNRNALYIGVAIVALLALGSVYATTATYKLLCSSGMILSGSMALLASGMLCEDVIKVKSWINSGILNPN